LVACLAIWWWSPPAYAELGTETVAGAAFVPNRLLWDQVGYFDRVAEIRPIGAGCLAYIPEEPRKLVTFDVGHPTAE
jgi:hypothetical protein